jgi:hypothetical protein
MSITQKDFNSLQPGVNELSRSIAERKLSQQQAQQAQELEKLRAYFAPKIAGESEKAQLAEDIAAAQTPEAQDMIRNGGSVSFGKAHFGADPYAHVLSQGPHQAQQFLKTAQGAYKGINDQLDAAQATIDALNQGNAVSDKVALINEARIAAGQGGSRAIAHLVDLLSGGQTAASDFQGKLNWLMNTPNIPTLQPAQRDAIREAVHSRLPQLEQQHKQVAAQLSQQGPIIAPQSDYSSLISSFTTPTQQKLDVLKKMQSDYTSARSRMQGADISQPTIANPNPTTLDRLKSAFGALMGNQQQTPQSGLENYFKGGQSSAQQGGSFGAHPQDNEAVQWARANPKDARAQQILKMNGVQ